MRQAAVDVPVGWGSPSAAPVGAEERREREVRSGPRRADLPEGPDEEDEADAVPDEPDHGRGADAHRGTLAPTESASRH